jgi:hypothetical protein
VSELMRLIKRAFVGCPKKFDLAISLEHVEH